MIEEIEPHRGEFHGAIRIERKPLAERQIVILRHRTPQTWMCPGCVAHCEVGRLNECCGVEPKLRTRFGYGRIHSRNNIDIQRLNHTSSVVELWMKRERHTGVHRSHSADHPSLN